MQTISIKVDGKQVNSWRVPDAWTERIRRAMVTSIHHEIRLLSGSENQSAGTVSSRNLQEVQDRVETVGVGTCGQRFVSYQYVSTGVRKECDRPRGHAGKHSENGVE